MIEQQMTSARPVHDCTAAYRSWRARLWPVLVAATVPAVLLIPFIGKAFTIDDTVFIWVARQIRAHPADFFGFTANWAAFHERPMYEINRNPPGVSYVIALVTALFGERETFLHAAFLVPAVAVSIGTYFFARRFCSRPLGAALCAVLTPVFILSSSNVMSDTLMLSFYVWAAVLWMRGLERGEYLTLVLAAFMIGCSALTKYFGITMVPLLTAYTLMRNRRLGWWLLVMLLPIVMVGSYELYTWSLYGKGMLGDAAAFAAMPSWHQSGSYLSKLMHGLAFVGGCYTVVLFFGPFLASRRAWGNGILLSVLGLGLMLARYPGQRAYVSVGQSVKWLYLGQWVLFAVGGMMVLALAAWDVWKRRDALSTLLLLWIAGAFVFSTSVNWTINGRILLPMAPVVGILIMRRLDAMPSANHISGWRIAWPLAPAACVAIAAMWGEYCWANSERDAAQVLASELRNASGDVYFMGHWGFQHYMEEWGAMPLSSDRPVKNGDVIILPDNNSYSLKLPKEVIRPLFRMELPVCSWMSTMHTRTGTGFYADLWGPLPFALGRTPQEVYNAFLVDFSPLGASYGALGQTKLDSPNPGLAR